MKNNTIESYYDNLNNLTREFTDKAIDAICGAKLAGRKVIAALGSGPNIHEGVTTLIAELIYKKIIDGVTTSSAVIAHELSGVLDRVKRITIKDFEIEKYIGKINLPRDNIFELTIMSDDQLQMIGSEIQLNEPLIEYLKKADGRIIMKAAGNMAYPMGLRTEILADHILNIAKHQNKPFEYVACCVADKKTMLSACRTMNIPILVSVPQLVGGGSVGICIAESIPISQRCEYIAKMMDDSDVIVESAVALTQEIHDGPYETYTGHGIWAAWRGRYTYSLKDKTIIRIDFDKNLYNSWRMEQDSIVFQNAINESLPKTKISNIPFRMEMSAFARHEKSIPITGDIGVIWPIIAYFVSKRLNVKLNFMSYPQQSNQGKKMREFIVENIMFSDKSKLHDI